VKRACLALSAVLLAATLGGADEVKPAPAGGPRIAVEPSTFDFGKAVQNKTLQKEFSIKNYGDADLVLDSVSTSCGCTVADGYTKVVKPGQSTHLNVSLQTRTSTGKLQKSVLIKSNDPTKSLFELKLEATVAAPEAAK
jgi:hypothetical protein